MPCFPRLPRLPLLYPLGLVLIVAGCATNRFAALPPGLDEDAVRAKVGRETRRIEHPDYVVHLHPGPKPGSLAFLKFRAGGLERMGAVPTWSVDTAAELPRTFGSADYYANSARMVELGLVREGFAFMRRWASTHPDSAAGPTYLGLLYVKGGEPDSAYDIHRAAVAAARNAEERTNHQNNLLAWHVQTRRYDEGEAYALELLAEPALDTSLLHAIRYNLACIYSLQNRKAKAVEQLKLAIDRRPDAYDQAFLDGDKDFENIRTEPGYLEQRSRLKPGRRGRN